VGAQGGAPGERALPIQRVSGQRGACGGRDLRVCVGFTMHLMHGWLRVSMSLRYIDGFQMIQLRSTSSSGSAVDLVQVLPG
jgi:hypothetical protein